MMKFMYKKQEKNNKNSVYKALGCIFLIGVMILFNSFFISGTLSDNIVGYWNLDENTGTKAINLIGTNNLTVSSSSWLSGKINYAIGDATTNYPANSTGQLGTGTSANAYTVSFWTRTTGTTGEYHVSLTNRAGASGTDCEFAFGYYGFGTGLFSIGTTDTNNAAIDPPNLNTWYHYVIVAEEGKEARLYRNGTWIFNSTSVPASCGLRSTAGLLQVNRIKIGGYSTPNNVQVDEIGVWDRALSDSEILQIYNYQVSNISYPFISNVNPYVILNSPENYYNSTNNTVLFNTTIKSLNVAGRVQNVSLYIDGVLNETNSTVTSNATYTFSKILSYGTHNWSILAYDNYSASNQSVTRFINLGIFENSRTYDSNITEGSVGTFVLNLSTGSGVTQAYLSYNGTLKSANINAGDFTTLTSTFTIPSVATTTNVSLFWIVYTPAANWNSTSSNQTILNINFDNCSVNQIYLFNFTILDEISKTFLNGTTQNMSAKLNIQVYPFASRTLFFNYSQLTNKSNPFGVCINSSLSNSDKFSIDLQIEYTGDGYEKEYYYIQNQTFNSSYKYNNISLYNLDTTNGQTFRLIYLDSSGIPVEDALIEVQRLYVEDDLYRIVEIAKTDDDGETQAKLQLNDVIYNFVVKKYGVTLATFNRKFVRCDNVAYDVCELKLNSFSSYPVPPDYTQGDDFSFTWDYNLTTRTITTTFSIPSGSSSTVVLNATLFDSLGETLACSDSIVSSSGTLTCVVPNSIGNSSVYVQLYKDGVVQASGTVKLERSPRDIYGASLVFLLIFMYLMIFGIGISDNPMITGIFLVIGAALGIWINLVKSTGFIGAGATVLWLIIVITLILVKGGKRT